MGLALFVLLFGMFMIAGVLAFLIGGIVFIVIGIKEKKKGGKGSLAIAGIVLIVLALLTVLDIIGAAMVQ